MGSANEPVSERKALLAALKLRRTGRSPDLLVGADGGVDAWRKCGLTPDLAVGDWDSLARREVLDTIPHVTLSVDKNRSDLYHACREALKRGADELVCLGVTGGRPDQEMATLLELSSLSGSRLKFRSVRAVDHRAEYFFLSTERPHWTGSLALGQWVSVFSMAGVAQGVTLKGFKYPLQNARLMSSSRGLSNRASKRRVEVSLRKGRLLVIVLRGNGR